MIWKWYDIICNLCSKTRYFVIINQRDVPKWTWVKKKKESNKKYFRLHAKMFSFQCMHNVIHLYWVRKLGFILYEWHWIRAMASEITDRSFVQQLLWTNKLRITGPLRCDPPVTGGFSPHRATYHATVLSFKEQTLWDRCLGPLTLEYARREGVSVGSCWNSCYTRLHVNGGEHRKSG